MAANLEMFVEFLPGTSTLIYSVNRQVVPAGPVEFAPKEPAAADPLADRLMAIDGVRRVGLTPGIVTVTCDPAEDLEEVAARAELVLRHVLEP